MRTTHFLNIFAVFMTGMLIGGCGDKQISTDDGIKARLSGTWTYEYKDRFDRNFLGTFQIDDSGSLAYSEKVVDDEGEPNEHGNGEWFVTSGLLKHKVTQINGKKLGSLQTGFLHVGFPISSLHPLHVMTI
ncbi:hypothetical protein [Xylophilus sp. GOD-11R]|uniref:hypothetical protein n=1 Tax=Xylophilus sp. GOD-11R TaxID=3089814 RepID=UPI00298C4AEB|nr:hypothetical protein [Xylophilus sp. GOD-11R]WPB55381.1 hypothetical protein R9X41_14660 [Xylophilus sp. GOD-11R]